MSEAVVLKAAEPDGAPRIAVLDILRGIAILGILFMNINDMGGSLWVMFGDPRHLGWSGADRVFWAIRNVVADGTARCMLEMLFGAGMVILTDRAATAASSRWSVMRGYYWRNIVLFGFGIVHLLILLWPGDILHTYAIAALIAFWFRRLRPRWLITVGLIMAMSQLLGAGYFGYWQAVQTRAQIATIEAKQSTGQAITRDERATLAKAAKAKAERAKSKAENVQRIRAEDKARTGSFMTWAAFQWSVTWYLESHGLEILFVWEALSTMLIGAALFRMGILQGARSHRYYALYTLGFYAVAFLMRVSSTIEDMRFDDAPQIGWATHEVARIAMTLGHVGAVNWLAGTAIGMRLLRPFVAAGRTALSIYICQTLITLWVLYPPFGLALYGTQGWASLMMTALAINALLLWGANVYLRHFDIAPVEWAWRSIVERRRLPWRRRAPAAVMGGLSAA